MKETNVEIGIILRATPHKEANVKLQILTASNLKTVYATGAAKQNAKLKSATQLFTIAEFTTNGASLIGAHVLQGAQGITRDINRYYLACSICEVLTSIVNSAEDTNAQIFYLTVRTFEILNSTQTSAYKIFINFFTKLLVILGYDIDISNFKTVDNENIDSIKLDLKTAKSYISAICESYVTHLDIKIPNTEIF